MFLNLTILFLRAFFSMYSSQSRNRLSVNHPFRYGNNLINMTLPGEVSRTLSP